MEFPKTEKLFEPLFKGGEPTLEQCFELLIKYGFQFGTLPAQEGIIVYVKHDNVPAIIGGPDTFNMKIQVPFSHGSTCLILALREHIEIVLERGRSYPEREIIFDESEDDRIRRALLSLHDHAVGRRDF